MDGGVAAGSPGEQVVSKRVAQVFFFGATMSDEPMSLATLNQLLQERGEERYVRLRGGGCAARLRRAAGLYGRSRRREGGRDLWRGSRV